VFAATVVIIVGSYSDLGDAGPQRKIVLLSYVCQPKDGIQLYTQFRTMDQHP
jgi:hypothetical protein